MKRYVVQSLCRAACRGWDLPGLFNRVALWTKLCVKQIRISSNQNFVLIRYLLVKGEIIKKKKTENLWKVSETPPLWGSSISYLKALKPKSFKICLIHLDWQQQVSAHKITKTQPLTTAPPTQPTPIPIPEPWPRPKPKSKSITKPSQCQQEYHH